MGAEGSEEDLATGVGPLADVYAASAAVLHQIDRLEAAAPDPASD
jgi:hypothetical protein